MGRHEDEDGIDGPFERAVETAMRDDAKALGRAVEHEAESAIAKDLQVTREREHLAALEAALAAAVEQRREALEILHDTYGDSPDLVTAARDVWSAFVRLYREKEAAVAERQAAERERDTALVVLRETEAALRQRMPQTGGRTDIRYISKAERALLIDRIAPLLKTAAASTGQANEEVPGG